ncbi:hypothetical protein J2T55_001892 [Methylohalomonas lacus]|uniref:Nucleotide modification associated domain-containing protein n=1 Tax=Methylohalomonas lacus TaxID=398773 RepID=A0AAE3HLC2_9GAMM|nr:hypothetical protein [Methylohalomonas lacus]MCS3903860.1 hypothetical protein [Methylohalomonas lacus]
MPQLYSYTIPIDDGAAPNPFFGMCTLAICKPKIRKTAQVGDWVVGIGSKNAPGGDFSQKLVYAMNIEEKMSLQDYDKSATARWPHRIPDITSMALQDRLGDCIYDFSSGDIPIQRSSVHDQGNYDTDLSGENVLISRDFYYFGNRPLSLPEHLLAICHPQQGHSKDSNDPYVQDFIKWIRSLSLPVGQAYGWPDYIIDWHGFKGCAGCAIRKDDDQKDNAH